MIHKGFRMSESPFFPLIIVAGVLLAFAGLIWLFTCIDSSGPANNQTEYIDKWGRVCTQVDPPGQAISIDCDYPKE
jgi:hypothetical protein